LAPPTKYNESRDFRYRESFLFWSHLVEAFIWAITLLVLPAVTAVQSLEQALYYSMVTFTTLGYGDITLNPEVRLLSGVEAMNGILLIGWSTAIFFAVLQRAWRQSEVGVLSHD